MQNFLWRLRVSLQSPMLKIYEYLAFLIKKNEQNIKSSRNLHVVSYLKSKQNQPIFNKADKLEMAFL